MLSTHPPDQVDPTTNFASHVKNSPRITLIKSTHSHETSNSDRQHWQKRQQHPRHIHKQDQTQQNDNAFSDTKYSIPIIKKQPWKKTTGQQTLGKKASNDSLRSNVSTTSSIFSTASKLKLSNVAKSAVNSLVAKSASTSRRLMLVSHNNPNPSSASTSPLSSSSAFGHRSKKRTPSSLALSNMFSRRRASVDQTIGDIDQVQPQQSISYSVLLKKESSCCELPHASSSSSSSAVAMPKTYSPKAIDTPSTLHRRLSKLNLSSSSSSAPRTNITASSTSTPAAQNEYLPPITSLPVGKLFYGENMDTVFDSGSSTTFANSDNFGTQNHRCEQDTNLLPQAESILGVARYHSDQRQQLSFQTFLVTATLTTLCTKLLTDCDRILAAVLQHPPPPFPLDDLKNVMQDLLRMTDLMGDQKQPSNSLNTLLEQITNQAPVREIITLMKQAIHDNVCQYYKMHEKVMIIPCKGYTIEGNNKCDTSITPPNQLPGDSLSATTHNNNEPNVLLVEHMDQQAHWFRTHFTQQQQQQQQSYSTFCGYDDEDEPILITTTYDSVLQIYRVITRTKKGPDRRDTIQDSFLLNAPQSPPPLRPATTLAHQQRTSSTTLENAITQQQLQQRDHPLENTTATFDDDEDTVLDTTWKAVIESSSAMPLVNIPFSSLKKIPRDVMKSSGLENDILKLDESKILTRYKFGILYIKEGQTKEEEWFANEHDSVHLDHFLNIIGRRIPLRGYTGWTAGLDTKNVDSGEFTYTSTWQTHSIAYHVSTLIPSRQGDNQQIQRKKHIGNDIVCIVFVEGKQPFNPAAINSQVLHVFIVVHKEEMEGLTAWRVEITAVENVPSFGPSLPEGGVFYDDLELQAFLLAKMINAEYAAIKSPKFAQPLARAREGILTNIVERGYKLGRDLNVRTAYSRHNKSPSTSSQRSSQSSRSNQHISDISPTLSRSSMIKDLSDGLVGLGRRKSTTQDSTEIRQTGRRQQQLQEQRKPKDISGSKQKQSEYKSSEQLKTCQGNLRTVKSNESLSYHSKQGGGATTTTKLNTKKEGKMHRKMDKDRVEGLSSQNKLLIKKALLCTTSMQKILGLKQRAQTIFTSLASKHHQRQEPTNGSSSLHPEL